MRNPVVSFGLSEDVAHEQAVGSNLRWVENDFGEKWLQILTQEKDPVTGLYTAKWKDIPTVHYAETAS